ncbi:MAG: energy transducer TonB, partial [Mesorhizobium sp.]|nr:energy transducer TonB [Mesorhizobium sp.]
ELAPEVVTEVARPRPRPEPKPAPKETAPPAKPVKRTEAAEPAKEAKPTVAKKAEIAKPAKQPANKPAAGSKGDNSSDAKRGVADGEAAGTKVEKAGKGKQNAAGNGAVTNYPGKVRAKLSRALRGISRQARAAASGDVYVAFTVTASGDLGGVSIARSSGSPALDKLALDAVRRAAPFPPIPDGSGRASWPFTIPLGLAK